MFFSLTSSRGRVQPRVRIAALGIALSLSLLTQDGAGTVYPPHAPGQDVFLGALLGWCLGKHVVRRGSRRRVQRFNGACPACLAAAMLGGDGTKGKQRGMQLVVFALVVEWRALWEIARPQDPARVDEARGYHRPSRSPTEHLDVYLVPFGLAHCFAEESAMARWPAATAPHSERLVARCEDRVDQAGRAAICCRACRSRQRIQRVATQHWMYIFAVTVPSSCEMGAASRRASQFPQDHAPPGMLTARDRKGQQARAIATRPEGNSTRARCATGHRPIRRALHNPSRRGVYDAPPLVGPDTAVSLPGHAPARHGPKRSTGNRAGRRFLPARAAARLGSRNRGFLVEGLDLG